MLSYVSVDCGVTGRVAHGSTGIEGENISQWWKGVVLDDRYDLKEELGRGGMGQVFLAWDRVQNCEVAVKTLSARHNEKDIFIRRFYREFNVCSKFDHPNIIKLFSCGMTPDRANLYYTMEVLDGDDLRQIIEREGKLQPSTVLHLAIQIASGLKAIHSQGAVHRDIKPANIVIDKYGRPVIMDFGLVFDPESTALTKTGSLLGTPRYMSPEQLLGKKADARSDIFQLGSVLHECLCGKPAFKGTNLVELGQNIISLRYTPIRETAPEISRGWEQLLIRCLSPIEDRYQSARELKRDLNKIMFEESATGDGTDLVNEFAERFSASDSQSNYRRGSTPLSVNDGKGDTPASQNGSPDILFIDESIDSHQLTTNSSTQSTGIGYGNGYSRRILFLPAALLVLLALFSLYFCSSDGPDPLDVPRGLKISSLSSGKLTLSWDDSSVDVSHLKIKDTVSGKIEIYAVSENSVILENLKAGRTYRYCFRSEDGRISTTEILDCPVRHIRISSLSAPERFDGQASITFTTDDEVILQVRGMQGRQQIDEKLSSKKQKEHIFSYFPFRGSFSTFVLQWEGPSGKGEYPFPVNDFIEKVQSRVSSASVHTMTENFLQLSYAFSETTDESWEAGGLLCFKEFIQVNPGFKNFLAVYPFFTVAYSKSTPEILSAKRSLLNYSLLHLIENRHKVFLPVSLYRAFSGEFSYDYDFALKGVIAPRLRTDVASFITDETLDDDRVRTFLVSEGVGISEDQAASRSYNYLSTINHLGSKELNMKTIAENNHRWEFSLSKADVQGAKAGWITIGTSLFTRQSVFVVQVNQNPPFPLVPSLRNAAELKPRSELFAFERAFKRNKLSPQEVFTALNGVVLSSIQIPLAYLKEGENTVVISAQTVAQDYVFAIIDVRRAQLVLTR